MRNFVLGAVSTLFIATSALAQGQPTVYGQARNWTVYAHTENGFFQGCSAQINTHTHWMRLENHPMQGWAVQVGTPNPAGNYHGYVEIDRASHDAQFDADGTQVNFLASDPVIAGIRAGSSMSLSFPGIWESFQIPLTGTAAAISKTQECVRNQGRPPAAVQAPRIESEAQRGHAACPGWASHPSQDMGGSASAYFVNSSGRALQVYWIDWNGILQEMSPLLPNEGYTQQTTVGHNFVARDRDGRCYGGVMAVSGSSVRFDLR